MEMLSAELLMIVFLAVVLTAVLVSKLTRKPSCAQSVLWDTAERDANLVLMGTIDRRTIVVFLASATTTLIQMVLETVTRQPVNV